MAVELNAFLAPAPGKGEIARMRLLEAALRVFGEKGLAGATVREIASQAGQNVAAIAYYFGGKDDLYRAVLEGIVRELRYHLRDILPEIARLRQQEFPTREEALQLLQQFFRAVYLRLLVRQEVMWIARIIMREQTQPSPAFEILYENVFRDLHEGLCYLVGMILESDPRNQETIIRTHCLMGQVWFFAIGRETILRRLGWDDLGGGHAEEVLRIFRENVDTLLNSLSRKPGSRHL